MDAKWAEIPVDLIEADPSQPRKWFDEDELASLGASMAAVGQEVPINVTPIAFDETGTPVRYRLRDGERRWRAAVAAGQATVDCIVRPANEVPTTPEGHLLHVERQRASAAHRSPLNPVEDADCLHEIIRLRLALNPEESLTGLKERLAKEEGDSVAAFYLRLRYHSLSPSVAKAVVTSKLARSRLDPLVSDYWRRVKKVRLSKRGEVALRVLGLIGQRRGLPEAPTTPGVLEPMVDSEEFKAEFAALYPDNQERGRLQIVVEQFRADLEREARRTVERIREERRSDKGRERKKAAPDTQGAPESHVGAPTAADAAAPAAVGGDEASGGEQRKATPPVLMRQAKSGTVTLRPINVEMCSPENRAEARDLLRALLLRIEQIDARGGETVRE